MLKGPLINLTYILVLTVMVTGCNTVEFFNSAENELPDEPVVDTTLPAVTITSHANGFYINNASNSAAYAVSGDCDSAGAEIFLIVDGIQAGGLVTGICDGSTWSATMNSTALDQGAHVLRAQFVYNGSSIQSSNRSFTKDTLVPVLDVDSPVAATVINSATNSATYAVNGSCDSNGQSVVVKVNGANATGQVGGACNGTSWAATINVTGLAQGAHTLSATLTDVAANMGTTADVAISKDTIAPVLAITSPAAATVINAATNSTTYTVSGTCDTNAQNVTVLVNAANATGQVGGACNGTSWAATIDVTGLAQGAHTLSAILTDAHGNVGSAANVAISKDTIAPVLDIDTPVDNAVISSATNSATYAVNGSCDSNGQSVVVKVNGANASSQVGGACNGTSWAATIDVTGLAQGAHVLAATLADAAGNTGTAADIDVTKDTVAPTLDIDSPLDNSYINIANNSATFAINGSCNENGQSVTVKVNGANAASQVGGACNGTSWAATIDVTGLAQGAHTLSATLADAAGNSGTAADIAVTKDTVAPAAPSALTLIDPASSPSVDATPTVEMAGVVAGDSIRLHTNSTCTNEVAAGTSLGVSHQLTSSTLSPATYTFYAKAFDPSGNSSACSTASLSYRVLHTMDLVVPIEMLDRGFSSRQSVIVISERSRTSLNTTDYDGTVTYSFEIVAYNSDTSNRAVSLINSAGTQVGSITVPASTAAAVIYRVSLTPTAGANNYRLRLPGTTNNNDLRVYTARIIVRQVAASKTRIHIPLTSYLANSATYLDCGSGGEVYSTNQDSYSFSDSFMTHWMKNERNFSTLSGANPWTLEASAFTDVEADGISANVGLYSHSRRSVLRETEVSNGGTLGLVSVDFANDIDFFTEGETFQLALSSVGRANAYLCKAGLWVRLEDLTKAEIPFRYSRAISGAASSAVYQAQRIQMHGNYFTNPTFYNEVVGQDSAGTGDFQMVTCDAGTNTTGNTCTTNTDSILEFGGYTSVSLQRSSPLTITDGNYYVPRFLWSRGSFNFIDARMIVIVEH